MLYTDDRSDCTHDFVSKYLLLSRRVSVIWNVSAKIDLETACQ